ncbi:MAG: hypothetical protein HZC40_08120 [Chloroflexi bacterium]|nr:hypothetical protein [Chloroflexota bacterium]
METFWLGFTLESDATFGRGDGVAGLVDAEVQHDEYGLPMLNGRTLKGLLAAECAEILFSIERALPAERVQRWTTAAQGLFGNHGSRADAVARMRVSDACLPQDLREAIAEDARLGGTKRLSTLDSLTAIRRQTAMDAAIGAPQENTLRASRVILRETPFEARLDFADQPTQDELALLAACVKAFRRAGTGKTRGHGRLVATLYDGANGRAITDEHFARFAQGAQG